MKITNQFWKLVTVGMILFCICFAGVINALAIDTPWIDMSQVTTQEETNEETQTPSEEGTTTPSQGTTGDKESEETANNEQTTPTIKTSAKKSFSADVSRRFPRKPREWFC